MKQSILHYWKSLSTQSRSRIVTGTIVTYVLIIPVLGMTQLRSMSTMKALQKDNQTLQQDLGQFSAKLDKLVDDGSASTVTQELRSLRDEVIKYRAEQQGRDQILGLSQYGSDATDPLDAISRSILSLEEINGSSSAGLTSGQPNASPVAANGAMLGTITLLKDKGWTAVDAFESPQASSKIIGQIVVNVSYPFYTKQNSWYQAELASGKKGWVQAQFVKEE